MSYFKGKKVLITAGPTYERIDDVRFIGNFSTGKMGFALAEKSLELGAEVILIAGPSSLTCNKKIKRIDVESAEDMYNEVFKYTGTQDIIIMSAAVADYTPKERHLGKIKKSEANLNIELIATKDILKKLGHTKKEEQIIVGFALESEDLLSYAKGKLESKKCNIIIANQANKPNSGFGGDMNTITIIDDRGSEVNFETASKAQLAGTILQYISEYALQH